MEGLQHDSTQHNDEFCIMRVLSGEFYAGYMILDYDSFFCAKCVRKIRDNLYHPGGGR